MTEPHPRGMPPASVAAALPTHSITIPPSVSMLTLLGPRDELLDTVERAFPSVDVHVRGNELSLRGPSADVAVVERLVDEMLVVIDAGQTLTRDAVERSITMLRARTAERPADVLTLNIISNRGRTIRPKTLGQKRYVDAIDLHTIVFGIGPAGTGKTYLAMAKAVAALQSKRVNRIILTRPAVEAGERLGFLPGTLNDKIDPYLRPLYDALHDMVDPDTIPRLMASGTIEVAPLAFMRGRSLNDAFVILDEAQNTSAEQMKMFLTRLGFGSKMVVTGDITQIDLPGGVRSGLSHVREILADVEDIHFTELTSADVVRHRRPPRHGPDEGAPRRRRRDQPRRRGRDDGAAREVDGPAGADRCHELPDGRAAPGAGRRRPDRGHARRHRSVSECGRAASPGGRSCAGRGAVVADHPRAVAPAGVRPRRAGREAGDVRTAAAVVAHLPRGSRPTMSIVRTVR